MSAEKMMVWLHVAAGVLALGVAPLAMVVQKGGPAHRRWGKLYFAAMSVICATALIMFWLSPSVVFLLFITVLAFNAAFTGYRVLYRKRPQAEQRPTWLDWGATGIALGASIGFIGWAILTLARVVNPEIPGAFAILGLVFGALLLNDARNDIRSYLNPPTDKNWWWFYHMERMLGSYVAVVTAFLVTNVGRHLTAELSWIAWVVPLTLSIPLIGYWIRHYEQKFAAGRERRTRPLTPAEQDLVGSQRS